MGSNPIDNFTRSPTRAEKELYQIRLVIMLHDGKETRLDEKKYRQEMARLEKEKAEKEELINTFTGFA